MQNLNNLTAAYHTLGCKLNFAETSSLRDIMEREGVRTIEKGEKADICIVNTCSVTDVADHKCRQAIHRFTREHPGAFVVVMGCYAQLKADEIKTFEGVDLVLGMEQKGEVVRYIAERFNQKRALDGDACHEAISVPTHEIKTFVPSCSRGDRTRYFLKVQDGCNYYCTYCTIPIARGRSRNGSIAQLVEQAKQVAAEGGKEIVITGVNTGDFGRSTTGETFMELIRALDAVEGIERYRISSIEPNLLTDEIIDFCAQSRAFMPHFHIPLQSGSDEVLKLMHRHYDTQLFAQKIKRIKEVMPHAFIGVDVIVGMRGETDELFEDSYHFIEGLDISQLHVFSYSERPGTQKHFAFRNAVSPQTKHARSQRLLALSEEKRLAHYNNFIGQARPVLWEHARNGEPMQGFTDNDIRVVQTEGIEAVHNELQTVKLGELTPNKDCLQALLFTDK